LASSDAFAAISDASGAPFFPSHHQTLGLSSGVVTETNSIQKGSSHERKHMRLTTGGVRELHWHTADEWAIVLYGNARIAAGISHF
jgi:hypothetical protein